MKKRLRVQKITIDIPSESSEVWVHISVEQITEDDNGNVISIYSRKGYVSRPFSEFKDDIYNFNDDILEATDVDISGSGLSMAIINASISWVAEKYGGTIKDGKLWL